MAPSDPVRVSTSDGLQAFLLKFEEALAEAESNFKSALSELGFLKFSKADEEVDDLVTSQELHETPLEPIGVFSATEGRGTKYRAFADPRKIINQSVCAYLFDEWEEAAEAAVWTAQILAGQTPTPDPTAPAWEQAEEQQEIDNLTLNLLKVRSIFDPPIPDPTTAGTTITIPPPIPPPPFPPFGGTIPPFIPTPGGPLTIPVPPLVFPGQIVEQILTNPLVDLPPDPLLVFEDKTGSGFDALVDGIPPPPSVLPGPFGFGKGRTFVPGSAAFVQVEPLFEGDAGAVPLRQGPQMSLAAVVRPLNTTSHVIASCSSVPLSTPFTGTLYSLELINIGGFLFPRLTWQYFDDIALATRTVFAQSVCPLPLPRNGDFEASDPTPLSTPYFVGVARYAKELNRFSTPGSPIPMVPAALVAPDLLRPQNLLNSFTAGDFITFGGDKRSYQVIADTGFELGMVPPYEGNFPVLLPFPKGKRLTSMAVTFYIGDLRTGNFFIDDFTLYGTDPLVIETSDTPFLPFLNSNLPVPNPGDACNFFIGTDPNLPSFYNIATTSPENFPILTTMSVTAAASVGGLDIMNSIAAGYAAGSNPAISVPIGGVVGPSVVDLPSFTGDMYMLSVPFGAAKDKHSRDQQMTDMFNACFADYSIQDKTISRTPRSQIPSGGTVFVNYAYDKSLDGVGDTSEELNVAIDSSLATSTNPSITSKPQLAAAIGVQSDLTTEGLELSLSAAGVHMVAGQPYYPGDVDVSGIKDLSGVLGYPTAVGLLATPNSVLVLSIQERHEEPAFDVCGNSLIRIVVTERILGVNISVAEGLFRAGVEDEGLLTRRLYWVGGLPLPTADVQARLNSFGLEPEDKASALAGISSATIQVTIIPDPTILTKLQGTPAQVQTLITSRPVITLDPAPSPTKVLNTLLKVAAMPAPPTADGDLNPITPFFALAHTLDLGAAFDLEGSDFNEAAQDVAAAADPQCSSVFSANQSAIQQTASSIQTFLAAFLPITTRMNFNISMAELALRKYIPCLSGVSPSAALGDVLSKLPSPQDLVDQTKNEFEAAAKAAGLSTLADRIKGSQNPLDFLKGELAVVGAAAANLATQSDQILCVPQTLLDALHGGVCGVQVPVSLACVNSIPSFQSLVARERSFLLLSRALIFGLLQSLVRLSSTVDLATHAQSSLRNQVNSCLGTVSRYLTGTIPPSTVAPAVSPRVI